MRKELHSELPKPSCGSRHENRKHCSPVVSFLAQPCSQYILHSTGGHATGGAGAHRHSSQPAEKRRGKSQRLNTQVTVRPKRCHQKTRKKNLRVAFQLSYVHDPVHMCKQQSLPAAHLKVQGLGPSLQNWWPSLTCSWVCDESVFTRQGARDRRAR